MREKAPTAIEQAINAELDSCEEDTFCLMPKACSIILRNYLPNDDERGNKLIDEFIDGKKSLREVGTEVDAHPELLDALSKKIDLDAHFNRLGEKQEQHGQENV